MALDKVEIPLFVGLKREKDDKLTMKGGFGGKVFFRFEDSDGTVVEFECLFDDLERGWNAIKDGL